MPFRLRRYPAQPPPAQDAQKNLERPSAQDIYEQVANNARQELGRSSISLAISGLAGGMVVFYLGSASVGTLVDITVGVQIIIAAVLGGRRTILGGALGAVFLIAMSEALRPIGDLSNFVVFALALGVVLFFPNGFFGLLTRSKEGA